MYWRHWTYSPTCGHLHDVNILIYRSSDFAERILQNNYSKKMKVWPYWLLWCLNYECFPGEEAGWKKSSSFWQFRCSWEGWRLPCITATPRPKIMGTQGWDRHTWPIKWTLLGMPSLNSNQKVNLLDNTRLFSRLSTKLPTAAKYSLPQKWQIWRV